MAPDRDTDRAQFDAFLGRTKAAVDTALASFLSTERNAASTQAQEDIAFVARVTEDLALRGGKRFRAALVAAAFTGFGGGELEACMPALVAFELLQVYFLIHDDWMDGDAVRRGGPSVPASLRAKYGVGHFADAASILAGDYACALAQKALAESTSPHVGRASMQFACIQRDVVLGQLLDMRASGGDETVDVERTYVMKTGTYTVRGPLELGATLAGADIAGIARFADPLGVAFQLRDDLLSTFGTANETGKPAYGDLRSGKRTWLVAAAMKDARVADAMQGAFGIADAPDAKVVALADAIVKSGARARVEARLVALATEARAGLAELSVSLPMKRVMAGAIDALTERAA